MERLAGGYEFVFGLDNWFVNAVAKSDLPNDQEIIILKDVKFKGNEVYFESKEDLKKAIKEIGECHPLIKNDITAGYSIPVTSNKVIPCRTPYYR